VSNEPSYAPQVNVKARVEREYEAPVVEVLRAMAEAGWEQWQVAKEFGVSTSAIRRWGRGGGIRWPCPKVRLNSLRNGRDKSAKKVEYKGAIRTLAEIARMSGISYTTVCRRHSKGDRGEALGRPVKHSGKRPKIYDLGHSWSDWQMILEVAEKKTLNATSRQFGVPLGAITAAQRGEWFRLV